MDTREYDLANFLSHPYLTLRRFIAPTILRLAEKRKDHFDGERVVPVEFKPSLAEAAQFLKVRFVWRVREWEQGKCYNEFEEELGKLAETLSPPCDYRVCSVGGGFRVSCGFAAR